MLNKTSPLAELKNYIITEYKINKYDASEFKFTHNTKSKIDKKTNINLSSDIIKIKFKLYDSDMNELVNDSFIFENNVLQKIKANKLVNISPDELNNKFNFAKNDICNIIMNEYNSEYNDLYDKINNLKKYVGTTNITPNEFKGESITLVPDTQIVPELNKLKNSKKFDM